MARKPQQEFSFQAINEDLLPTAGQVEPETGSKTTKSKGHQPPRVTPEHHLKNENEPGGLREMVDFNFIQYASYVICDRAIPYLQDGLKPVQRRILHALHHMDDGRFIKVANVVGHTMQYHPHGDASIGDALVGLTNKRYLIEGQGNFGNVFTGDRAAASRYIECRLTDLARKEIFNRDLTEFVPSYDGRNKEPVALPAKLPLLLMLGAEGIAVGLSTRILPHNFSELLEAEMAILQKKPFKVLPDFLQGGLMDASEYDEGRGKIKLRAKIEEHPKRQGLVIREIPWGTTTESVIASIEDAARKKKVPVRAINDFTAADVEIELLLSPGTPTDKAVRALYAFTACEVPVSTNLIVIHNDRPVEMTVGEVLRENVNQLLDLLKRELLLRKHNLEEAFHEKTLVQIFIENRIYKQIEECTSYEAVIEAVFDGLKPFKKKLKRAVTREDVEKLLEVRIKRISRFDINKNRKDIEGILAELAQIEKDLARPKAYALKYLRGILKTYGKLYPRRTQITTFKEIAVRELTARELKISYDSENGYIGHAINGAGDPLLECSSLDKLVMIWDDGRYCLMPPPEKQFVDKNLLYCNVYDRERVITMVYTDLDSGFTYLKRFNFGGMIMNRDYQATRGKAKVLYLKEGTPETLYVKYRAAKRQRINQQQFHPEEVAVKGAKSQGNQMTAKSISVITDTRPRWWSDDEASPRGVTT